MKADDALKMTLLYDYYGELLTSKQRTCFDLYYNQDFSLAEIAEQCGISRQGVHDSIARAETALLSMEEKTGCVARSLRLQQVLQTIDRCTDALCASADGETRRLAAEIRAAAHVLEE
ncbi:MAG: YlxM family DNA-binding protein [Faecousia sp.]|nr:YlxM family DNA-binding protein [Bacillota bacterium]MDY2719800.1 YlxM family DNA-binding protein [Candidatus Faecousia sp.]